MGKESEAKRALFSLGRGGHGERSVRCGPRPGAHQGRQVDSAAVPEPPEFRVLHHFCSSHPSRSLAWKGHSSVAVCTRWRRFPPTAVVPSAQTVQSSFKGKDSQRRPSPRPAVCGSPARREQNLQGPLLSGREPSQSAGESFPAGRPPAVFVPPPVDDAFLISVSLPPPPHTPSGVRVSSVRSSITLAPLCPAQKRYPLSKCGFSCNCPSRTLQWLSLLEMHDQDCCWANLSLSSLYRRRCLHRPLLYAPAVSPLLKESFV